MGAWTIGDFDERMKKGFKVLTAMGREKTILHFKDLYPDLYTLSVGYLFGEIWSRLHLTLRERELITLASNISLARPQGNQSRYQSAKKLSITHEEIMEVIIQIGHYCGWPTMALAVQQYIQV